MLRIGRPVGTCLGDFDKTGSHGERWVASIVADGEHFVAERRNQEEIHIGKNARHFLADFSAEAIVLHEIDGGKKTGLAEEIGPRIVRLHFEPIDGVRDRELFKLGSTFGEKIDIE